MPDLELEGFQRVNVPAGQKKTVVMPLTEKSLMYWDTSKRQWSLKRGKVKIMVGSSSRDIKLSKVIGVPWQVGE
ncbi:MAG: fibronectin type III-like domain-contianing protein [Terriglobia bacterium]|nr:fibronectin type III-like domain-contianing protein [Terriglobia bacterium]